MSSILSECMQICGLTESLHTLIPECTEKTSYDHFIDDELTRLADILSDNDNDTNNDLPNDLQNCTPTITTTNCIPSGSEALSSESSNISHVRDDQTISSKSVEISREVKPIESYIQIIATTILESTEQKLVLSELYENINKTWPKFSLEESTWKNSIRHSLSTNDCFRKNGRAPSGRGYYWSIHPACLSMFTKGDFRRRETKRRVQLMQQKMNKQKENNMSTSVSTSSYVHRIPEVNNQTYPLQSYNKPNEHQQYWMNATCLYNNSTYSTHYPNNYQSVCTTMSSPVQQSYLQSTSPTYMRSHPVKMTSSTTRNHPYNNKRTNRCYGYTSTYNTATDTEHVYNSNTYTQHQDLLQQYYCR